MTQAFAGPLSPVIKNGDYILSNEGLLIEEPDIVTQLTVAITINLEFRNYLKGIRKGGQKNELSNIIKNALNPFISDQSISNLAIQVKNLALNYVQVGLTATDNNGNDISLSWSNI